MTWIRLANENDVPEGVMRKVEYGALEITLVRLEGQVFAFNDRCPHMNAALHQGSLHLESGEVICALHKARFDVRTGAKREDPRIPIPKAIKMGSLMANVRTHNLRVYPVKVEGGAIFVELDECALREAES